MSLLSIVVSKYILTGFSTPACRSIAQRNALQWRLRACLSRPISSCRRRHSVGAGQGVLGLHVLCRRWQEQMPDNEVLSPNQMQPARQAIRPLLVYAYILRLQQLWMTGFRWARWGRSNVAFFFSLCCIIIMHFDAWLVFTYLVVCWWIKYTLCCGILALFILSLLENLS